jgi:hypothetical protein
LKYRVSAIHRETSVTVLTKRISKAPVNHSMLLCGWSCVVATAPLAAIATTSDDTAYHGGGSFLSE